MWGNLKKNSLTGLENAYAELVSLAVERRSRLEESRQLWQFYWDMAEEENWIKEMGHVLSQADIGHDLTTINLLLSKHNSLETEIRAHENSLRQSMSVGQGLIDQGHFGSDNVSTIDLSHLDFHPPAPPACDCAVVLK